jgi:hypothetical protein
MPPIGIRGTMGWHHLKHVALCNVVCFDLEELHQEFHLAIGRLRQKPHLVRSFFAQARLVIEQVWRFLRNDQQGGRAYHEDAATTTRPLPPGQPMPALNESRRPVHLPVTLTNTLPRAARTCG